MRVPNLDLVIQDEENRLTHSRPWANEVFYKHFSAMYRYVEHMSRVEFMSIAELSVMCKRFGKETHSDYDMKYLIMKHYKWNFHTIVRVDPGGMPTSVLGVQMVEILIAMDSLFKELYGVHRWDFDANAKFRTDNSST